MGFWTGANERALDAAEKRLWELTEL